LSLVGDNYEPMPTTVLPNGTLTLHSHVLGLELRLVDGILRFVDPPPSQRLLSHREAEQARQEAERARQEAEERARREAAARAEAEARLAAVEAQLRALREQREGL
jgi:regulator of protease activity HflC (stomatin/prohibitin superfamily)